MLTKQLEPIPKISVKIWRPIIEKLNDKLNKACLRRDAYLCRVLEIELEHLDSEVSVPNSEESYSFVAERLDLLDRKLVSLALPIELTSRLNEVCTRKRIVRDAFFNRLFFLLAVEPEIIDALFFTGEKEWRRFVWQDFKVDGPFFQNGFYPLDPDIDPFWALRVGLEMYAEDVEIEDYLEPSSGQSIKVVRTVGDAIEPEDSIYSRFFDQKVAKTHNLLGFNCYVPDWRIPGHPAEVERNMKLDDFLRDTFGGKQ